MALNIIISILIWGTAAVVVLSILCTGGLPLPAPLGPKASFLDKTGRFRSGFAPARSDYVKIFSSAFVLRVVMALFAAIAICLFMGEETLSFEEFLNKFVIWDANSYVNI